MIHVRLRHLFSSTIPLVAVLSICGWLAACGAVVPGGSQAQGDGGLASGSGPSNPSAMGSFAATSGPDAISPLSDSEPSGIITGLKTLIDFDLWYIASASPDIRLSVPHGVGEDPLEMDLGDRTSFDHDFLVRSGLYEWGCKAADCWTWTTHPAGRIVRIKLQHTGFAAALGDDYRDISILDLQADGTNLSLAGMNFQDGDVISLYLYMGDGAPEGTLSTFVPIPSGDFWSHFKEKSYLLGVMKVKSTVKTVYKKKVDGGVRLPIDTPAIEMRSH